MLMRSSLLAACVALLSAPVALAQEPPRGAWNGLTGPEMEDLQWTCSDGSSQMNQILDAVQTTYELQQEVNSYLGGISSALGFNGTTGYQHALSLDMDSSLADMLGDDASGGWDDGVLTADEMNADPEGAAMLLALRQSIADQLGIPIEDVILTDLTDDTGNLGRRRALGEKVGATKAFGFCQDVDGQHRCSLSV